MPIETDMALRAVDQEEFGRVAYEVVGNAFAIHKKLGRIFDETTYLSVLKHLFGSRAEKEVCIRLTHAGFEKRYFIDLVVDLGCPFELKVVSELHDRHRGQLIQYLMLTGLRHGKLINFGRERVEHEFVNCHETTAHRRTFGVDLRHWPSPTPEATRFYEIVVGLLRDWGTGLDKGLYVEAITHFLVGPEVVRQPIESLWHGDVIGRQMADLIAPDTAFEITCLRTDLISCEDHLRRFLANTSLARLYWVNIVSGTVTFVSLTK